MRERVRERVKERGGGQTDDTLMGNFVTICHEEKVKLNCLDCDFIDPHLVETSSSEVLLPPKSVSPMKLEACTFDIDSV